MEIHVLIVAGSLSWDTYVEEVLILKELEPGANDPVGIHLGLATSTVQIFATNYQLQAFIEQLIVG
jgi:hypothetical protein